VEYVLRDIILNYSMADFLHDLILIGIAYGYILLTILIPVYLRKKDLVSKFVARKIVHLCTGLVVLIVPFFILPLHAVLIALTMTILVYFSGKDSSVAQLQELYESIGEQAEEKVGRLQGPFHYSISITLLIAFFAIMAPNQLYFPISGILIMIISDTLAPLVGRKYGKIKIPIRYTGSQRTLEGSLTFLISAFILCYTAFYYFGLANSLRQLTLPIRQVFAYALITALSATIIELLSPSTWDDLTVPITTTMIIYMLAALG
jgi:dolichol kinase